MSLREGRRTFLARLGAATSFAAWSAATVASGAEPTAGAKSRPPKIVLRSSWQTVNIGDIAHTPGVLKLLQEYLPEAEVRLWPSKIDAGVKELLLARFPKLQFVEGAEAQDRALKECDFFLHGSGPALVARRDLARWRRETGKPYGIYCITRDTSDIASIQRRTR